MSAESPEAADARVPAGYRFGPFLLEPRERRLSRDGAEVALTAKQLDTLLVLVAHAGRLVSREELIAAVWPDTIVEEGNLTWAVSHLRRILGDLPCDPIATVRGHGYRFVWPVTAVEHGPVAGAGAPARSEASARSSPAPEQGATGGRVRPRPGRRWLLAGVAAAAALVGVLLVAGAPSPEVVQAGAPRARRLAVISFQDVGGRAESAWLAPAVSELVSAELAQTDELELVSREEVARAVAELELPPSESYGTASLLGLGRSLTVEYVVAGSIVVVPGEPERVQVNARLQRADTGRTLAVVTRSGTTTHLIEVAGAASEGLRAALGFAPRTDGAPRAQAQLPSSPEARRAYVEAGEAFLRSEMDLARARFEAATRHAPDFALGWLGLARTLLWQGEETRARAAAERAFQLAAELPESEHLRIEAVHRRLQRELPAAVAAFERLADAEPRNADHLLELAQTLALAGRESDGYDRLAALRERSAAAARDARVDVQMAALAQRLGRTDAALAAARRGRAAARAQGSPRLELAALLAEAFALAGANPPRPFEGLALLADAGPLRARAPDPQLEVRFEWLLGNLENAAGVIDPSRLERAPVHWRRALARAQEIGWGGAELSLRRNLGLVGFALGDLVDAEAVLRAGLERAAALESRDGRARFAMQLSQLLRVRGALAEARRLATEAAAFFAAGGNGMLEIEAQSEIADLELADDRPRDAAALFRSIAARYRAMGRAASTLWAETDAAWAEVELPQPPAGLREHLRAALGAAAVRDDLAFQGYARGVLARALLRAGDALGAEREARRALELAPLPRRPQVSTRLAQVHAEALLALGRQAEAEAVALRLIEAARASGARLGELEGRFLLARLALLARDRSAARVRLDDLALDAREIGYRNLLRRVEAERTALAL